jgi:integrase
MTRFTKGEIDKAEYSASADAKSACFIWDHEVRGLGVRIYPSGRKTFVCDYRTAAQRRRMTLGDYGTLTLDQARAKARKALAHVDERDPMAERERIRKGETFADLCREYMERHAKVRKRSWKDDARRINQHFRAFSARKVASFDYEAVSQLFRKIGKENGQIEANRTLSLLSKMFALAQRWGMFPADKPNPARGHDRYREIARDRWITPAELPRLAEAIDHEPNEAARAGLWLYLLTGARKTELLAARWQDVDTARRVLRLPATKAGRPHEIPLSEPALAILHRIPRHDDNPFILIGKRPGRHLVNIGKPWQRVRKAAGVADVRLHDLRRTVGSWLAQSGNSLNLIGKVLNHSSVTTTAVYARMAQDQEREALEQMGKRMLGVAGIKPGADVVPIKRVHRSKAKG